MNEYQLWDLETRNLIEEFETEGAALDAADELIVLNPPAYPAALGLVRVAENETTTWLAWGDSLAERIAAARHLYPATG
jgi:hypothetical protein